MRQNPLDPRKLDEVSARLGDAVVDPALWRQIIQEICGAVGATGAVLFQSDERTPDVPATDSIEEMVQSYFRGGWHARDLRAIRGIPLMLAGARVITDQDLFSPEEMDKTAFYNETLFPFGFKWFAGVAFKAGSALWGLSIQRTVQEGPYESEDKKVGAVAGVVGIKGA